MEDVRARKEMLGRQGTRGQRGTLQERTAIESIFHGEYPRNGAEVGGERGQGGQGIAAPSVIVIVQSLYSVNDFCGGALTIARGSRHGLQ
jgi:hypothetical protein